MSAIAKKYLKQEKLLGKDIALNDVGNFSTTFRSGYHDLAVIAGIANMNQALLNRMKAVPKFVNSRLAGSLPAHPQYGVGITVLVSAPHTEVLQQTRSLILVNLNAEPRIKTVQSSDIKFTWDNGTRILDIVVTYTVIGDEIPQNLIFPIYIR